MYVKLDTAKRFFKDGVTYRSDRVYSVPEERGDELCSIFDNDMPLFRIVTSGMIKDTPVIDLGGGVDVVEEDYQPEPTKLEDDSGVDDTTVTKKKSGTKKKSALKKPGGNSDREVVDIT